jgi:hypothetical protein
MRLGEGSVRHTGQPPQTVDHIELVEHLTEWIQSKGLSEPAVLFLEASKPLLPIGGQLLLLFEPVLGYVGSALGWTGTGGVVAAYATLLEDPVSVDRILVRLERGAIE